MNALVPLPFVVPLLGAALAVLVGRSRPAQRVVSVGAIVVALGASVALLLEVDGGQPAVSQAGDWPAPLGITLIADRFAAIMLTVSFMVLLAVLVYAIGQGGVEQRHVGFHPVYLILAAGVALSFLTGDLFTMFVGFEMLLTASFVLITLGGRPDQVRAGMTYVVLNLVASLLFLIAVGWVYAATGTVNMADLVGKLDTISPGLRHMFAVLFVMVFGIKAGLFPLFFWLPDSYPTAPGPVTAIFAGLLTKVGVYAIIRSQTLLFPDEASTLLLVLAGLTMAVGVLGAIAQYDVKRILSFHIVSHVGNMVMGLAFFTLAGLAGAILYTVHHIVVMTGLFLTGGLIERAGGSSRLSRIGGLAHRAPAVAVLFAIPALSLAGVPPFSGFVAKLALVQAGFDIEAYAVVGISLVVSALTLFSMVKIWAGSFWGVPEEDPEREPSLPGPIGGPTLMVATTAVLVVVSLAVAVFARPLYDLSERAAADLLEPTRYVHAVMGR